VSFFVINYNDIKNKGHKENGCSRLFVNESLSEQYHISYYINIQLTPWSRVLFDKLTVP